MLLSIKLVPLLEVWVKMDDFFCFLPLDYMEKYHVQGIPHAFIIDKDGKEAWHGHPFELEEELIKAIEKVEIF